MIPSLVMMALGPFRFGVAGSDYQQFSRTAAYRWSKVDRLGRTPALQYAGPDTQQVSIDGVIYPHFKGGLRQMDKMRAIAATGQPLMMVDGLGWVWKRWVITQVREDKSLFLRDGAPRKIEFTISLQVYGADADGGIDSVIRGLV